MTCPEHNRRAFLNLLAVGERIKANEAQKRAAKEHLDLADGRYLGRLDDLQGRAIEIVVSAFVYVLREAPALKLSDEVRAVHWVRFDDLLDPSRHAVERFDYRGHALDLPVVRLDDITADEGPPLWGLTYRFVELFFRILGHPLPSMPWREDL